MDERFELGRESVEGKKAKVGGEGGRMVSFGPFTPPLLSAASSLYSLLLLDEGCLDEEATAFFDMVGKRKVSLSLLFLDGEGWREERPQGGESVASILERAHFLSFSPSFNPNLAC